MQDTLDPTSVQTRTRILDWLACQAQAMQDLLQEVVDIDSGSRDEAGIAAVAGAKVGALLDTQPGVQHACEAETSFWLHLDAAQVRQDEVANALCPDPDGQTVGAPLHRFWSFTERAPVTGVIGDPRAATAEKGEALLTVVAEALAAAMRDARLWRTPDPVWTPGRAAGPWDGPSDGGG